MKNNILLLVLLLSSINILSCSPAGILASGGATGMVVAEGDRSFGTVVDDATIKINIASKFINSDDNLFIDVGTNVLEGRVLLTGLVDNQEIRIDAVRRVWDVEGVNEVINEIQIGNRESIKEYAQDLWITTQVRGLAAKTIGLRSISYNFETIQGRVYIAGITSRADQLEELVKVAKTVKGVTEIINYVIIKE
ncbi:MAG: BON domain-containing protein [Pelagibacteraceae bacterium]|jgi:osmotically-inducible protein OsmY|nr:BON domain-containing protein [Pelagibacteraceae bacterium]MBT5213944.1 BON domain-containing protein [Pelagibacteraceae bacterium]